MSEKEETKRRNGKQIISLLLVLMVCLMFGLSIADTIETGKRTSLNYERIMNHVTEMVKNGPHSLYDKEENRAVMDYMISQLESYGVTEGDTTAQPAYLIQDYVVDTGIYQNWYLSNLIVHIPANSPQVTGDAVMVMAHFDSVPMGPGASDDTTACSVMLETIRFYLENMANGTEITNDLVFCFVNGEEFGLYGSEAFMKEFDGFGALKDRIKFAINLEARGTAGTQIMFETSANNFNTIKMFAKVNKSLVTCSVATMIYDMMPNGTDFSNYKEFYQGVNIANIGGGENYHTQNDDLAHVGANYVTQQAQIVEDLLETLATYDLDTLYEADESAIFFSYLNIGTVYYNHVVVIILGVLLILMVVANVVLSVAYRKENNIRKTIKGIVTIVAGLGVTAGLAYGFYYLFQLLAALFGTIDIHTIGKISYSNTVMIVGIGFLALGVTALTSALARKLLKIENRDIVRAFSYIHAIIGIVLSFVLADASYLFVFSGILFMINELVITVCKEKAQEEYHFELLATALYVPVVIPIIELATSALGLGMCYVFALLFALALFAVGAWMKPVYGGISVGISVVLFVIISLIAPDPHMNLQGKQAIKMLPYDDALVYAVEADGKCEYLVYDLDAYSALKKYAPELTYRDEMLCYASDAKPLETDVKILSEQEGDTLHICLTDEDAFVNLTFLDVDAKEVVIDDGKQERTFVFDGGNYFNFRLHDDCTLQIKGGTAKVAYQEVLRDYEMLIPADYDASERLHFNLWLLDEFELRAE